MLSVLYHRTLLPSTGNSSDTAKFGYLGVVLGTAHAPGYPLYTMLDALWVRLFPFGDDPAWQMNVLSAAFAVATCLVLQRILRLLGVGRGLATVGAVMVGLTREFWMQSVVAEVYTLNTFLIAAVLVCLVGYERSRHEPWLVAAGVVFVLSFAHHTSAVLLLPGLLGYAIWRRTTFLLRPRNLGLFVLAGLAVLASYGYVVWRAADPSTPYVEADIHDVDSFVATVTGSDFGGKMFAVRGEELTSGRMLLTRELLDAQLGWLLPLTVYGVVLLARHRPPILLLTGLWTLVELGFGMTYRVGDWYTFLVPAWMLLGLWTALGLAGFVRLLAPRASALVVVTLAALVPVGLVLANLDVVDQSGDQSADRVHAGIDAAQDGSVIFVGSYPQWHQFQYVLLGEGVLRERDVFAVKGRAYGQALDEQAVVIADYCAAQGDAWPLPRLESYVQPSLETDRPMYVFGDSYAADVAANGFGVVPVEDQLYRLTCPGPR